jgi:hypothetical protein
MIYSTKSQIYEKNFSSNMNMHQKVVRKTGCTDSKSSSGALEGKIRREKENTLLG